MLIVAVGLSGAGKEAPPASHPLRPGHSLSTKERLDFICQNAEVLQTNLKGKKLDGESQGYISVIRGLACPPQP